MAWSGLGVGDGRFPLINWPALSQDCPSRPSLSLHIAHHFLYQVHLCAETFFIFLAWFYPSFHTLAIAPIQIRLAATFTGLASVSVSLSSDQTIAINNNRVNIIALSPLASHSLKHTRSHLASHHNNKPRPTGNMFSRLASTAAVVLAASSLTSAQTFSACNPLKKTGEFPDISPPWPKIYD